MMVTDSVAHLLCWLYHLAATTRPLRKRFER